MSKNAYAYKYYPRGRNKFIFFPVGFDFISFFLLVDKQYFLLSKIICITNLIFLFNYDNVI